MYFDNMFNAVGVTFAMLDLVGVFLNALVGGLVARRMKFDAVGFMLLAIISGMAGGMIRDGLIGDTPASALQNPWYIGTALVGAVVAFVLPLAGVAWELIRFHLDMVIVGVWASTGTVAAMKADVTWFGCVLMGVLTATGGMVIREMMIGQVPKILMDRQLYVVPAMVSSISVQLFYARARGSRIAGVGRDRVCAGCGGLLGGVVRAHRACCGAGGQVFQRAAAPPGGRDAGAGEFLGQAPRAEVGFGPGVPAQGSTYAWRRAR